MACFTLLDGFDDGSYICEDIVSGENFTPTATPASDERALCINGAGGGGGDGTSDPDPVVVPPGPTQSGIVEGCRAYYLAVSGDGCWAIADDHGISLDDLYAWNPALNGDCSGLWPDYAYCVEGPPASSAPVSPPGPTQPGTIETCQQWHLVVSGDGCWDLQQLYGIPDYATFRLWNPALGDNCEGLWLDYAVCVGV